MPESSVFGTNFKVQSGPHVQSPGAAPVPVEPQTAAGPPAVTSICISQWTVVPLLASEKQAEDVVNGRFTLRGWTHGFNFEWLSLCFMLTYITIDLCALKLIYPLPSQLLITIISLSQLVFSCVLSWLMTLWEREIWFWKLIPQEIFRNDAPVGQNNKKC